MYIFPSEVRSTYEKMMIPLIFLAADEDGAIVPVLVSDGLLAFHGLDRSAAGEYLGGSFKENIMGTVHPEDLSKVRVTSDSFVRDHAEYNITFKAKTFGEYHLIHAAGYWQTMPDGSEVALIVYTDMHHHEEVMARLVDNYGFFNRDDFYNDALTDLPNLNYLNKFGESRIKEIQAEGAVPVVMYFDVDSMQSYNNKYGFQRGDQLLVLVANILSTEFLTGLVARGADDHFIVIDRLDTREALAEKLTRVNNRIKRESFGITTGIHAGICPGDCFSNLSEAVDHAIRANKLIREDLHTTYRFYSEEDDNLYRHQRFIVENFFKAMNNGWIKVYYQCFLRLETGNGMGFEALARWKDPEHGIISPGDFIPALEKYRLMHELDLYMFEQVCRELKLRHEAGLPLLPVSVNFSRYDFDYIDIAAELNRIVDKYEIEKFGIDRSFFMIEITEQGLASATDRFYEQLDAIRKSGFKLWVDDFGSGYSSLNVFSSFDIDLIKFDMDLLRNLDAHNGANRYILKAMVMVAKKLGIHTLCEGLETEEQRQFLLEIGCELAQGYLYHKPEGLDTIFERLNIGLPIPAWECTEERLRLEERWAEGDFNESFDL